MFNDSDNGQTQKAKWEEIREIINSDVSYDDIELIINEVLE